MEYANRGNMSDRPIGEFGPAEKRAVYDAISLRRDIRNFRPEQIPEDVLHRLLEAAHSAGSVGYMQPWDFIVIRSPERKAELYELFRRANDRAASRFEEARGETYRALKLQGILDAPLSICVTCDTLRGGEHILGRDTIPETDRYSTCLAVQNLWLAARAEGIGVGWMSIVDNGELALSLSLPEGVVPIAFLCIGYPVEFPARPTLATTGWRDRVPLETLVHAERWGGGQGHEATQVGVSSGLRGAQNGQPASHVASTSELERGVRDLAAAVVAADPDGSRSSRVRARLDDLAKPKGSLGSLEALAVRLACAQGRDFPAAARKQVLIFAGDHGVTDEGVSAYRPDVTARLCYNMMAGGAVINALLRTTGATLDVVDVGVNHAFDASATLTHAKVAFGTKNIAHEPAMTRDEALRAILAGAGAVSGCTDADIIAVGEVGIGNTTASAALLALLTNTPVADLVGLGTGIGSHARERKIEVCELAVRRTATASRDEIDMLAGAGGFEIAAMTGAILSAAGRRIPVVLDGFIAGVAGLLAQRIAPSSVDYMVASHRSAEPGHGVVLDRLGLNALLALDMRLGEASGAALALPLAAAACDLLRDVRTFREAGIDPPIDERGST
jgi:nicotinate-nucleotide--dimethylbenzimidazole phosphoribosyltransferase